MLNPEFAVFQVLFAAGLWHFFFFAVLIFLGPFYLKNLISAVVVTSYEVETMSINEEDAKNGELLATAFSAFTLPGNSNRISTKIQKDTNCNVDEYDRRKSYGEYDRRKSYGEYDRRKSYEEYDRRKSYEEYDRRKSYEVPLDSQSDIYQLRELEHRAPNQDEISNSQTSKDVASLRKELYRLVSSRELEVFITFCIVANTVVMATEHYGMSSTLDTVISVSNY
ncbi:sodium channel type 10 subunit alpha isoform X3, partial [Paramuricea clavata]